MPARPQLLPGTLFQANFDPFHLAAPHPHLSLPIFIYRLHYRRVGELLSIMEPGAILNKHGWQV